MFAVFFTSVYFSPCPQTCPDENIGKLTPLVLISCWLWLCHD